METPAAEAFKKLKNKTFPDADERNKLALFLGVLLIRPPAYIAHIAKPFNNELNLKAKSLASHKESF